MPSVSASFFWIALCAVIAPLVAGLVPRKLVPEVVLLLIAGVIVGPHVLDLAVMGSEIDLLRELGLGMLFLLAGYEINTSELTGRGGRRALITWLSCLVLAFVVVGLLGLTGAINAEIAVAIALTSTALGTLLPILKDSGMLGTRLGRTVLNHGAFGELGPVIAMAILLSSRSAGASLVVLAAFAAAAVGVAFIPAGLRREGSKLASIIRLGSETTAQTTVRLTILLLVTLIAVATIFDLDIILGAFAAGFILRRAMPSGDEKLEAKLDGLAFGLLIPIFFVTSGMAIDVKAVAAAPGILLAFLVLILLVRGLPVFFAERFDRGPELKDPQPTVRERGQVALYAATGLPLIVAVTGVAVNAGQMTESNASILVAAGAITVLVLPLSASLLAPKAPKKVPAPATG
ncbi:Kef-type K+ transport system membrane component KefB [Rhodococcus sp. PvR044]|uniref:cation:proton antiporter n=1 Tax=Rhodococcus TaxID=1827 RepID=UPI000BDD6FF7|nr:MULTISPECIES: cation:proton antiporter [Rhodococcus]MBP1157976.1 Kef-type K+ transport system membrane component KefB [Rhodococcus sp. PvR099]MCZ4554415.1 cation:proton antiporter [Rhodococcus maanshanensis]PTR37787.1 transporter (CPA2 family) [Rhodococcus sp. OK611]SNX93218.1 transporter, CPA2 family [Rhodococcus sp. OK270]